MMGLMDVKCRIRKQASKEFLLTYFDVRVAAVILKKTALASLATAFARSVLPFPRRAKQK